MGQILVIGYGNPGRLDDGLGPALAKALAVAQTERPLSQVTVGANYQLTVEDAAVVAEHQVVVFVDAAVSGPEPYMFSRIVPQRAVLGFSTYSVSPQAVLGLAHDLFGATCEGYLLAVRGYEFNEFGEALSCQAQANLAAALQFLLEFVSLQ